MVKYDPTKFNPRQDWKRAKTMYAKEIRELKFKDDFGPTLDKLAKLTEQVTKVREGYIKLLMAMQPLAKSVSNTYDTYKLKIDQQMGKDTKSDAQLEKLKAALWDVKHSAHALTFSSTEPFRPDVLKKAIVSDKK